MAGLAGSFLVIATMNEFNPIVISGRGWIAVVLVVFGRWTPRGILFGALFFGFVEACSLQFQVLPVVSHIPYQFYIMLPYLLTIVVLFSVRKRLGGGVMPTYLAVSYRKGSV